MNCHIIGIEGEEAFPVKSEMKDNLHRFQEYIASLVARGGVTKKMYSAVLSTIHFNQDKEEWQEEIVSGRKLAEMQHKELLHGEDPRLNAMVSPVFLSAKLFGRYVGVNHRPSPRSCETCGEELPENWLYEYCGECMLGAGIIS